ncbi:hypothetical protein [Brachyspira innocens]|uniref:hypothetical protein n=1 Tax=Brachyspira innocens TaxID=13264 RepID=UPI0003A6B24B|nr:hypothetical protein [Brachyspira innocens]
MAARESKTSMLEKKVCDLEEKLEALEKQVIRLNHNIGLNEDGSRNGNGLIHKIDELKDKMDGFENYINNLTTDFIKIDHRLEKLENLIADGVKERVKIIEDTKEERELIKESIKELKEASKNAITVETLAKFQKAVVGIAGFIAAMGTIIGAVLYFTK